MAIAFIDQLENELLACLCRMLSEEGRPPCVCHFYSGDDRPPADRCSTNSAGGNGQAWLRRDTSQLSTSSGNETFGGGICAAGNGWETVIELGIYRCISAVADDNGRAPSVESYNDDRELMNADKQTLYRVLCCDTWDDQDAVDSFGIREVRLEPLSPKGGCAGSSLTITVSGNPSSFVADNPGFASSPAGGGDGQLWQSIYDST